MLSFTPVVYGRIRDQMFTKVELDRSLRPNFYGYQIFYFFVNKEVVKNKKC